MIINITYGAGEGPTELAAFDTALCDAGIGEYNLILLSSIIPPESRLKVQKNTTDGGIGNRLYVVLSKIIGTVPGDYFAGLGWATRDDGSGIFMEENSQDRNSLNTNIRLDLESAIQNRKRAFGDIEYYVQEVTCNKHPVCAVVAAVYRSEQWDSK